MCYSRMQSIFIGHSQGIWAQFRRVCLGCWGQPRSEAMVDLIDFWLVFLLLVNVLHRMLFWQLCDILWYFRYLDLPLQSYHQSLLQLCRVSSSWLHLMQLVLHPASFSQNYLLAYYFCNISHWILKMNFLIWIIIIISILYTLSVWHYMAHNRLQSRVFMKCYQNYNRLECVELLFSAGS